MAVWLIWGSSYLATAIGIKHLPPFLFSGGRFVLAGLGLLAISLLRGNRPQLNALEWRHLACVAFGLVVLSNGCNVWGMQWMSSHQAALLSATAALWIAVMGAFGPHAVRFTTRTTTGLLLGLAGTLLILQRNGADATESSASIVPELVVLLGVFGWSAGTIYLRNAVSRLDVMSFTGLQMLLGGVVLCIMGIATGELRRWNWRPSGILALLYLLVFSSGIAYAAYAWLAKHASPAIVGTYSYVNPGIAALLGWWFLDEQLTAIQLIGMTVMLSGVILVNRPAAHDS